MVGIYGRIFKSNSKCRYFEALAIFRYLLKVGLESIDIFLFHLALKMDDVINAIVQGGKGHWTKSYWYPKFYINYLNRWPKNFEYLNKTMIDWFV